jgi:hypothetical protein
LNAWGIQLSGKSDWFECEKVTLPAANTADGVGDSADRLMQGRRYEQWIASAPMKRWDVGSNLSRLRVQPQWLGQNAPVGRKEQFLTMRRSYARA